MFLILNLLLLIINVLLALAIIDMIFNFLLSFGILNFENSLVKSVYKFLDRIFFHVYYEIRKFVPCIGCVDLSPLIFIIFLTAVKNLLMRFV
ncbi:MAG: YggT family protein [Rickettsiales bacterium]|nr:YggT family protein [Rickettsiales bacterium]